MVVSSEKQQASVRRHVYEAIAIITCLLLCLQAVWSENRKHFSTHLAGAVDNRMFLNVLLWDVDAIRQGKSWHELWQFPSLFPEANILATSEHILGAAV